MALDRTPLFAAASHGHVEAVRELVEAGGARLRGGVVGASLWKVAAARNGVDTGTVGVVAELLRRPAAVSQRRAKTMSLLASRRKQPQTGGPPDPDMDTMQKSSAVAMHPTPVASPGRVVSPRESDDVSTLVPSSGTSPSTSPTAIVSVTRSNDTPRLTINLAAINPSAAASSSAAGAGVEGSKAATTPTSATSMLEEVEKAFERSKSQVRKRVTKLPQPPPSAPRHPSYLQPPHRPSAVVASAAAAHFATHSRRRPSGVPRPQAVQAVTVKKRVVGGGSPAARSDSVSSSSSSVKPRVPTASSRTTTSTRTPTSGPTASSAGQKKPPGSKLGSADVKKPTKPTPEGGPSEIDRSRIPGSSSAAVSGSLSGGRSVPDATTADSIVERNVVAGAQLANITNIPSVVIGGSSAPEVSKLRAKPRNIETKPISNTSASTSKGKQPALGSAARLKLASPSTPRAKQPEPSTPKRSTFRKSGIEPLPSSTKSPSRNKLVGAVNKMVSSTATLLGFLIKGGAPRKSITAAASNSPASADFTSRNSRTSSQMTPPGSPRRSTLGGSSTPRGAPFINRNLSRVAGTSKLANGSSSLSPPKDLPPSRRMASAIKSSLPKPSSTLTRGASSKVPTPSASHLRPPSRGSVSTRSGSFSSQTSAASASRPTSRPPSTISTGSKAYRPPVSRTPSKAGSLSQQVSNGPAARSSISKQNGPTPPLLMDPFGFLLPTPTTRLPLDVTLAVPSPVSRQQAALDFRRTPRWREMASEVIVTDAVRAAAGQFASADTLTKGSTLSTSTASGEIDGVPLRVRIEPMFAFPHTSEKFRQTLVKDGVPQLWRGHVWYHLLVNQSGLLPDQSPESRSRLDSRLIAELKALQSEVSRHEASFPIDIELCFPSHLLFFGIASQGRASLLSVLRSYTSGEQSFGYWRGLSKVAAVLLLMMEEERAYIALNHLFFVPNPEIHPGVQAHYGLRSLIASGKSPNEAEMLFVHEEMMRVWTPKLFDKWVARGGLATDGYLFAWISSLFVEGVELVDPEEVGRPGAPDSASDSSFLPFRVLVRLLDLFMLWGSSALHVFAVALLKKHEAFLLTLDAAAAMEFLLPPPPSARSSAPSPPSPAGSSGSGRGRQSPVHAKRPCWSATAAVASAAAAAAAPAADLDAAFVRSVVGLWSDSVAYPAKPIGGATSGRKLNGRGLVARLREVYYNGTV
ncbi:Rab GTPase-activating protein 1 [Cladochytrium tenue]|nr:Rab GTPase-activating protein 1 [Cladochytrium tenue]